ncbi:MAG: SLC13 family permease [Thermoplasmata archaeon]
MVLCLILIAAKILEKTAAAAAGAVLTILLGFVSAKDIFDFHGAVHWDAVVLIFSMFVLVECLTHTGFFTLIGEKVLAITRFHPVAIFVVFSVVSAILAAFMDSITVMIFMAKLTYEVTKVIKISPVPFVIAQITSANIGGAATMVGDPPNVIIGTSLGYSFLDFVFNTGPVALIALVLNITLFYLYYRSDITSVHYNRREFARLYRYLHPPASRKVRDFKKLVMMCCVFLGTIVLLVLHGPLSIPVSLAGFIGASVALLLGGKTAEESIKKIDWSTLVFFIGLFIIVGGLQNTGVTSDIASALADIAGGKNLIVIILVIWISFIVSSIVDNVPFASAMVPVIKDISSSAGIPLPTLAWSLALGCDIGGNSTPIGASANVVALSTLDECGRKVSWAEYCKSAIPITVAVMTLITVLVVVFYEY